MKYAAFVMALVMPAVLITRSLAQDNNLLHPGKHDMTYFLIDAGSQKEFATFSQEVTINDNKTAIYTVLHSAGSNNTWIDTSLSNSATLAPVYHSEYTPSGDYVLHYGKEVTGYYLDKKTGKSIPLPKEAAACIKTATVYDHDGHFEFTNLMPGDYMLMTQFGYLHGSTRTEVTGYTDTYIDGAYVGTMPNTNTYNVNEGAVAGAKKVVTIKQDGEKVTMKLKQTL